jgi:hypothetical protein
VALHHCDPCSAPVLLLRLLLHGRPLGIRRYNMFWSSFENKVPSAVGPLECPAGTTLLPATEPERKAFGYHRFHCYSSPQTALFDTLFELDRQLGAQNAAIIYGTPDFYRHPNCTGFKFGPDTIKSGCAPVSPRARCRFTRALMSCHVHTVLAS